jgi:hypothetical protein
MPEIEDSRLDEITQDLARVLDFTANEKVLLRRLEELFSPTPSKLADTKEEVQSLERRLGALVKKMGGPPRLIIVAPVEQERRHYDTYISAAITEMLATFHRCRSEVCRTHMFYIGAETMREHPDWIKLPENTAERSRYQTTTESSFWEHAEIAFIRLAAFWDRVGQLLDFIFFNIRQYERDGFPTVMDRIRNNFVPVYSQLEAAEAWKSLRRYQNSENVDGFKWLIRRRNLLVHSLHLRPMLSTANEDPIFTSSFNHLDDSLRNKLKPQSLKEELEHVHSHLSAAATLFVDVVELCEIGAELTTSGRK